jgi:hypothetical protein
MTVLKLEVVSPATVSVFWVGPISQIVGLSRMVDFQYRHCHRRSATDYQIQAHRLYYTVALLPTEHTYSYR